MRDLMEEIELADQVGLDVFGVGEHHRPDFVGLGPGGRPGGRGGAHEAHPADQRGHRAQLRRPGAGLPAVRDARPALGRPGRDHGGPGLVHRVVPALRLRPGATTTSCSPRSSTCCSSCARRSASPGRGEHRPAIDDRGVYPRPVQEPLPVWVAVGGTPAVGDPRRDARPAAWRWRSSAACRSASRRSPSCTARRPARPATTRPRRLSINSHGFIADTSQQAADDFLPRLRGRDGPDRAGAGLAADDAAAVRGGAHAARRATSSAARRR